jgi:hypothetical protein
MSTTGRVFSLDRSLAGWGELALLGGLEGSSGVKGPRAPRLGEWIGLVPGRFPLVAQADFEPAGPAEPLEPGTLPGRPTLDDDFYELEIAWETAQGKGGAGAPIKLVDDDGIRFFYVDEEHEMVIEIFDPWSGFHQARASIYSRPWIDVDVEVTMLDRWRRQRRRYLSRWI